MAIKPLSCVLCEDIRPEIGGKATLVGYVGVLPNVIIGLDTLQAPLRQMMLLFQCDKGVGRHALTPRILDPHGGNVLPGQRPLEIILDSQVTATLGVGLRNVLLKWEGEYRCQLLEEGRIVFDSSFAVQENDPSIKTEWSSSANPSRLTSRRVLEPRG